MPEIIQFISKHFMLSLAWFILFSTVIVITIQSWFSKIKEIANSEAIRLINKENAVILDLRSKDDYRHGHITNSLNLTETVLKNGNLSSIELAKNRPVVVINNNHIASRNSANKLYKA
ncbi:MAG: rhodanese-like domain-containing protein, partial [Candidatus Baumannia cicadellinicola]|nr:rhodanese-like domain-containing protein [Candidatus Baumannia cicadellinicola]